MTETTKNRVLCVDDEPRVLEGLALNLRRHFQVITAAGAAEGVEAVTRGGPFAVVVSDMRMPGMDGATFLSRVRQLAPDTVRILLTGQADLDSAILAVNEGQIFRFLTKPCAPNLLLRALQDAVELHRLINSERVLLEKTLHGAVQALADVLAMANPTAFGRANRAKLLVSRLAEQMGVPDRWQVEVAAMLSQLGSVTLPPEIAEKLYHGSPLSPEEQRMAARLPRQTEKLLAHIPRLEGVCAILRHQDDAFEAEHSGSVASAAPPVHVGARLLKVALDFDLLETQGHAPGSALDTMRGRRGVYDPSALAALAAFHGGEQPHTEMRQVGLGELAIGMRLAEDLFSGGGALLVARGQEVTPGLLERLTNFSVGAGIKQRMLVVVECELTESAVEVALEPALVGG